MPSIHEDQSPSEDRSFLYVVQLGRSRIKVGMSTSPRTRIAYHRGIAKAHGCLPGAEWVSPRGSGTVSNENALIRFCADRAAAKFRNEYFTGVSFLVAVREGARICGDREAKRILRHGGAALALTALAEKRKQPSGPLPSWVEYAEQQAAEARLINPWPSRPGSCTEAQAAEWLGVPEAQIAQLISSGKILRVPSRTPNRRLYLRTADVQRIALRAAG